MKKICIVIGMITSIALITFQACKKNTPITPTPSAIAITDDELFQKAFENGYTFYQDRSDTLPFTPNAGGHSDFIRVLFNPTAKNALGSDGKLPLGKAFPDGSLIVKQIYKARGGPLYAVSIMYKRSSDPNSSQNWVWGEYYADKRIVAAVGSKGTQCAGCHSTTSTNSPVPSDTGNRDLVRTFGIR